MILLLLKILSGNLVGLVSEKSVERTLNGDKKRLLNCCLNMGQNIELSRIQNKQCNLLKKCIVNKPFSEL